MRTLILALAFILPAQVMAQKDTETVKIKTSAVCNDCKEIIEHDMKFEKGVESATLDVKTKVLTVQYNPFKTTPKKLREAVADIGYNADDVERNPKAYKRLPKCCQAEKCEHGHEGCTHDHDDE